MPINGHSLPISWDPTLALHAVKKTGRLAGLLESRMYLGRDTEFGFYLGGS